MEFLATENIVKIYGKRTVVDQVNIEVRTGEIVGLLGPNGAGKTTIFYTVVGLVRPDRGRIILNADDITNCSMCERARMNIGYLAQEASVFRKLSVWNNIMAVLEYRKMTSKERKEKAESLLEELYITKIKDSIGETLSGGERRRVEIARCLAADPKFVLLDEPFAGVDPIAVSDIQEIIKLLKEKNLGVLITDHSVRETLAITDRAYIISEGKILISGNAEQIINDETAKKVYLGDTFSL